MKHSLYERFRAARSHPASWLTAAKSNTSDLQKKREKKNIMLLSSNWIFWAILFHFQSSDYLETIFIISYVICNYSWPFSHGELIQSKYGSTVFRTGRLPSFFPSSSFHRTRPHLLPSTTLKHFSPPLHSLPRPSGLTQSLQLHSCFSQALELSMQCFSTAAYQALEPETCLWSLKAQSA